MAFSPIPLFWKWVGQVETIHSGFWHQNVGDMKIHEHLRRFTYVSSSSWRPLRPKTFFQLYLVCFPWSSDDWTWFWAEKRAVSYISLVNWWDSSWFYQPNTWDKPRHPGTLPVSGRLPPSCYHGSLYITCDRFAGRIVGLVSQMTRSLLPSRFRVRLHRGVYLDRLVAATATGRLRRDCEEIWSLMKHPRGRDHRCFFRVVSKHSERFFRGFQVQRPKLSITGTRGQAVPPFCVFQWLVTWEAPKCDTAVCPQNLSRRKNHRVSWDLLPTTTCVVPVQPFLGYIS